MSRLSIEKVCRLVCTVRATQMGLTRKEEAKPQTTWQTISESWLAGTGEA